MDEFPENDALWKVLGQAPPPKASPYFVRKVLREVRLERQAPSRFSLWLRWLTPLGAAAVLALGVSSWQMRTQDDPEFNAYFDSAADLESLVAFEELTAWADLN
jgi:hypothetical protein